MARRWLRTSSTSPTSRKTIRGTSAKKIRGPMLTYRAEPGYTVADNLEVLIINNEGFAHRYIFTIKVVAAKARR